ncbi:o-succinylbenzoate synthase [Myroides odoratimimus]|uniref:o-succinylbenzoate synthase n=1 Tax=Myroides odoratimimus TaxID=76832 RepID=UPI0025766D92|nr:o-succinylbenzoate synthase [Myroides odoratimimus]MDM1098117.1 o-succinylbenzoate synthase [Myroides odoratimimus]MDM1328286.1 o-succinylbenzoate synthase [Myroides odoratimimus]MDM1444890.1 o-succinylbenzoate synthase [Myroides odoratimimus]MDM1451289.1 o-succinylbenzoate synthase [Myroides odoratimimus]MDM1454413.1 o-succinylbenzoate synthase [Myroides odoratimimus]
MIARYKRHNLIFKRPSGTSRGILTEKETWYIILEEGNKIGIGECGILRSLSFDDRPDYEEKLKWTVENIDLGLEQLWEALRDWPSIQFGLEQAFLSLESDNPFILFPSNFTNSKDAITINGLVWMGEEAFMKEQIDEKLKDGYKCVKLKIGAINFEREIALLQYIRKYFSSEQIELRVDANGGFKPEEAKAKLEELSKLRLHSIEQPIKQHQISEMAALCRDTPLPIALDEELIGITKLDEKAKLLDQIRPQYIILKPSLIGGFKGSLEWIELANQRNISWWITSALESNIGLNAIAQWTYTLQSDMPQGLGTGALYTNNIDSPLLVKNGALWYDNRGVWDKSILTY